MGVGSQCDKERRPSAPAGRDSGSRHQRHDLHGGQTRHDYGSGAARPGPEPANRTTVEAIDGEQGTKIGNLREYTLSAVKNAVAAELVREITLAALRAEH